MSNGKSKSPEYVAQKGDKYFILTKDRHGWLDKIEHAFSMPSRYAMKNTVRRHTGNLDGVKIIRLGGGKDGTA